MSSLVELVHDEPAGEGWRVSIMADGATPANAFYASKASEIFTERATRFISQAAEGMKDTTFWDAMGPPALVVTTISALLSYHLLSKIIFGGRPKDEQPSKFALIAFTRFVSASFYLALSRNGFSWRECWQHIGRVKVWFVCLPYSVGLLATYVTAMMSLEHIAFSARNAIMQSRLLLDLLIGTVVLNTAVSKKKAVSVLTIISAVGTSMLTIKQSSASKNPTMGMLIMLVNNCIASCTYAYFPFVLPRFRVPSTICSFICTVEVLFLCVISVIVETAWTGGAFHLDVVFKGFQWLDVTLVAAISVTDACYFFVPILLPPIALTLCVTTTIPCGFFIENLYFGLPFVPVTAVSMLTVGIATISYVANTDTPRKTEGTHRKDLGPPKPRAQRTRSLASSSGFASSTSSAGSSGGLAVAQADATEQAQPPARAGNDEKARIEEPGRL